MTTMENSETTKKRGAGRTIRNILLALILFVVLLAGGLLAVLAITEYKPAAVETAEVQGAGEKTLKLGEPVTMMCWNIGYGALGDNADFFMDGGKGVKTADLDRLQENLYGIQTEIWEVDPDILLLQEVDQYSTRSEGVDEMEWFRQGMEGYSSSFANNFKVAFLPYPIPPIGKVDSGIGTFSQYGVSGAERIQLPIPFSWPVSMVNLKRCLLVSRMPIEGSDKELVVINLHLEAYDSGEGKIAQTEALAQILEAENEKGNYVIAGGDFNQIFSNMDQDRYPLQEGMWHSGVLDVTQIDGEWKFLMNGTVPTCRSLDQPYAGADRESFQYYLIDGYVVSENVKVEYLATQDLDFRYSDHNPVVMRFVLD